MSRRHFAFDLFGDGEPVAESIRVADTRYSTLYRLTHH